MASESADRRAVVTGLGAVTPLGLGVPRFWEAILRGESGAAPITSFDVRRFTTTFACQVKGFDATDHMDRKLAGRLDPYAQYGLVAAGEALADAGLEPGTLSPSRRERIGVVFGSGQGGLQTFQEQARTYFERGPGRLSPFFVPKIIGDMAAGIIAMEFGFRGPNHGVVSACATGNQSLADALDLITTGRADIVVAGGSDAAVCELGLGGFAASRALSTRNDSPETASRPFDADRDGFVLGEGAGALVVESLESARARGVRIQAELLSVGSSADAHHMTAPHPEGIGARLALRRALDQAGIRASSVDTINAHGTSTPLGDSVECRAIRHVLRDDARHVTVTSTKSMTGHLLGAAGAVEAVASVLSLVHQVVPPTINLDQPDPDCDLPLATNRAVERDLDVAVSNAFGFGGHNTSAVFRRWSEA